MSEENEFAKIKAGKVVKAAAVGAGVVGVALVAPIGLATVVGLGLAGAASSWFVDSASDSLKE